MSLSKGRPVLVTTSHRGVFFGYAGDVSGKTIDLADARNCVYWSSELRGFMGLATSGPTDKCKIGPKVSSFLVHDVTSVSEVEADAVKKWEAAPWQS